MKITLQQVLNSEEAMESLTSQKLTSAKTAYRLMRNARKLDKEFSTFADARNKLHKSLATVNEETGHDWIDPEDKEAQEKWRTEINVLLNEEIDVDIHLISIAEMDEAGAIVSAADLFTIDFMISDYQAEINPPEEEIDED